MRCTLILMIVFIHSMLAAPIGKSIGDASLSELEAAVKYTRHKLRIGAIKYGDIVVDDIQHLKAMGVNDFSPLEPLIAELLVFMKGENKETASLAALVNRIRRTVNSMRGGSTS